jgi:diguanylate cyclase (GGDEF)-like protein
LQKVGTLQLIGDGDSLLRFLGRGMAGIIACLVFSALAAIYLSRRLVSTITGPMRELAEVAHDVRRARAFDRRVPPADIAELNELGEDFNALLDEFEGWQANLQTENTSLSYLAAHDGLTGLWNRTFFETQLRRALRETRAIDQHMAVLFVDCDRFKDINDQLGHAAGDAVLATVAKRLLAQVRESDVVARMGGDEFAILLARVGTDQDALRIADNIIASMLTPIELPGGETVTASISIGVAVRGDRSESPDSLLQRADAAMYQAKHRQRSSRHISGGDEYNAKKIGVRRA